MRELRRALEPELRNRGLVAERSYLATALRLLHDDTHFAVRRPSAAAADLANK